MHFNANFYQSILSRRRKNVCTDKLSLTVFIWVQCHPPIPDLLNMVSTLVS